MAIRDVAVGDQASLTIDFSTPVTINDFKVDDIDYNVTFTASVGGVNIPLIFTAVGVAPTITTQPSNSTICEGTDTTFTILTSNADTYQWQLFNGSSWDDLTNSGIHSTTTTNTLTITNASASDDGNRYRVIVSSSTYACDSKTSEERILTVNAAPTISVTSAPTCSADSTTYSLEVTVSSGTVTSTSGTVNNISGNVWSIEGITPGVNIDVTATAVNGCKRMLSVNIPLSCLIANDDTVTIDGDTGGNSINVVNDNDILDGNGVTLGVDVTITTVADPNPGDGVSLNPTTGEVTVLPNTPPGDYTIIYTLCSIAIPLACDDAVITITVVPAPNGTITGHLYSDLNDNSTQDIGEPDLEGVDVNIIDVNGVEQIVTTDLNGDYIANVPVGATIVDIDNTTLPLGSLQTEGTDPTTVTVIGTGITIEENNGFIVIADVDDQIIVYTGISPNGDGINDQFRIVGLDNFPNNTLQIFNRWGVKIFEQDRYEQSGTRFFEGISEGRATIGRNKELPVGTYFYVLEYENASGINMSKAGYLYINR
ncbi:gliding motility-associated C-terminal domain-containing protein [Aquimarina macrocephali]|uniref:gliding motility-associated C-terminal domain-containing protein n=1 Tax=Aquimarina macrocephali TaxID=666563 RepID=UPI000466B4E1|nr:T9SS C-terminal target domain-containing protein [Aquimarina macrocephali]